MHFLLTNDDGIDAPGLHALALGLQTLGEVTILAPNKNWSACGHVKTLRHPLRVSAVRLGGELAGLTAFSSDGAPSDCVALAHLGAVERKFDFVVSGINPHLNLGQDVTYSGTVTAAMEAALWGYPALAVSTHWEDAVGYEPAVQVALQVLQKVQYLPMPQHTLLNLNVPTLASHELRGIRITRQGLRVYRDELVKRLDPLGKPYYWIGGWPPSGQGDLDTDIGAIDAGWASLTPLHLDLSAHTHRPVLEKLFSAE